MNQGITFVGMDAHKKSISVSMLLPGQTKPVEWQVANETGALKRMVKKIEREAPGEVRSCYEAGRSRTDVPPRTCSSGASNGSSVRRTPRLSCI